MFLFLSPVGMADIDLPQAQGWVNDFAGVISPEYQKKIKSLIYEVNSETSAEIVVVTMGTISPYTEFAYAQAIFDKWKIGKKGKDNGVLILLAVKERRWRIHTGYGMEGFLTDVICHCIGTQYLVPYFKDGKYAQGLYYAVKAVANSIAQDAKVTLNDRDPLPKQSLDLQPPEAFPAIGFLACVAIVGLLGARFSFLITLPSIIVFAWVFLMGSGYCWFLIGGACLISFLLYVLFWKVTPIAQRTSFARALLTGVGSNAGLFDDGNSPGSRGSSGPGGETSGGGGGGFGGGSSGGGGAGGGF